MRYRIGRLSDTRVSIGGATIAGGKAVPVAGAALPKIGSAMDLERSQARPIYIEPHSGSGEIPL